MPVTSTPAWSAGRSGLLGDPGAVAASAQLNQLLGTHADNIIYQGAPILTPFGQNHSAPWFLGLNGIQYAQPFTLVGTSIGRVAVPLLAVGNGADLIVSLCANNAGVPGTILTQTRIPASWICQLSAITGTVATPNSYTIQYTNNPLALAQYNSLHVANPAVIAWPYPTTGTGLSAVSDVSCYYGNYMVVMGGVLSGAAQSGVYTIGYDNAGNLGQAIPQQSLPAANDGSGAAIVSIDPNSGNATLVITGGAITSGGAATTNVFTASLDTNSGAIASWSTQTPLPAAANNHAMASYNGFVYLTGGSQSSAVTYGQVSNGQITSWTVGPSIPSLRPNAYFAATNGFLFWIGGFAVTSFNTVYYAAINANGSLGPWMTGPSTPVALSALDPTVAVVTGNFGIVINAGGNLYTLAVGPNGPDIGWLGSGTTQVGISMGLAGSSPGIWQYYGINTTNYDTFELVLLPRISVPLPATGLTNGSTYFIVLDQAGNDLNNRLQTTADIHTFPGDPTFLFRPKTAGGAWTPETPANYCIPISIYDNSATGPVWHTWEDSGTRISTLAWATTPDQRLLGILEAVAQPPPALNMNPSFTAGTAPWQVAGGTLARSTAHVQTGVPFSALITPSGSASQVYILSELVPVYLFHTYTLSAWIYSPTGWANTAVNINWYDNTQTYISTTSGAATSVPANTWTQLTLTGAAVTPPNTAAYAALVAVESGTPATANVFYVSQISLVDQSAPMLPSVVELDYAGTWPSSGVWPPVGVSQLA